jgi:hypothetical protein
MANIRIVYAAPGEKAEVREIEHTLEAMQGLVGGYLEKLPFLPRTAPVDASAFDFIVAFDDSAPSTDHLRVLDAARSGEFDLILNEEGLLLELDPNRLINGFAIVGPLFITKATPDGEWMSLTEEEAARLADILNAESAVCRTLRTEEVPEPSFAVTDWEQP